MHASSSFYNRVVLLTTTVVATKLRCPVRGYTSQPLIPALLVSVLNYVPSHEHASGVNCTQTVTLKLDGSVWSTLSLYALVKSL